MKVLDNKMKQQFSKHVSAHRGASGLVEHENTIEAFEKAIEVGADSIECDVRKTKDGIIVINHNADIYGLLIKDHTYNELNEECNKHGYHLATLIEGLNTVKDKIALDIEIKEVGYEDEILNQCLSVLNEGEFYFRSFYDSTLLKMKELNPNITTVLLLGLDKTKHKIKTRISELFPRKRIRKCKCDAISPYHQLLLFGYCKRVHRLNCRVYVWTVNNKELMEKVLYKKKADGVVTNYPNIALDLVKEKDGLN